MSMTYGGDQITFNDNSTQNTAATGFGFKNRIINGAMMIDQRNAGASVTLPATGTYTLDRWNFSSSQASKATVQQNAGSVTPPSGFAKYFGYTVGASANVTVGASDYFVLQQRIEGNNLADMGFGASGASSFTISFWVRSSLTGSFGIALQNAGQTRSYATTYTINSANTWEQKTITVSGDISGTWATDNTTGLVCTWGLGVGSTYAIASGSSWSTTSSPNGFGVTGTVQLIQTNGATFYITGVQLEKGSTATSFDYRPYGTELALAQRYCQVISGMSIGRVVTNATLGASFMAPTLFRTAPTASNITYTLSTGATGTPSTFGASVNGLEFFNSASNWTTTALCQVSATLSAEL